MNVILLELSWADGAFPATLRLVQGHQWQQESHEHELKSQPFLIQAARRHRVRQQNGDEENDIGKVNQDEAQEHCKRILIGDP